MALDPELRPLFRRALRSSRGRAPGAEPSEGLDALTASGEPRGAHTLEVRVGTVVGVDGRDVFVEFGPRFQGVWRIEEGATPPAEGTRLRFTLRGTEEGLWSLDLPGALPLDSWRSMRVGDLVEARVTAPHPFGLELRAGDLHGFMPHSQLGLGRRVHLRALVGHRLVCEVLGVESHRQRVILSRRLAQGRERERGLRRADLREGRIVSGRVTKIAPYGVFVDLGPRLRGLVHVSNLAHGRVEDPRSHVELGATIEVLVLSVARGGRRISLGLKQLQTDPLDELEVRRERHDVVLARSAGRTPKGCWFDLPGGVRALAREGDLGGLDARAPRLRKGETVPVRLVRIDPAKRQVDVSLCHRDGRLLTLEDSFALESDEHTDGTSPRDARLASLIGRALRAGGGFDATGA